MGPKSLCGIKVYLSELLHDRDTNTDSKVAVKLESLSRAQTESQCEWELGECFCRVERPCAQRVDNCST